ncbi:MAG: hypothetical protein HY22_01740 [[Candidatus Thermochlorobacteriaceae] bacterium GBChlB]|nr:MAG: hypothetical protein HY22_01740 [[Candidatus Thermochlorobacteriaceae] bacterium GBChlB]
MRQKYLNFSPRKILALYMACFLDWTKLLYFDTQLRHAFIMPFTSDEIALLSSRTAFDLKFQATEKLKTLMGGIRDTYLKLVEPDKLLAPPETDFKRGQIAKGENYEGYPYVMLDFPKFYGRNDIFTYRTMFWYGNYFIFSVILSGSSLQRYHARLEEHYDDLAAKHLNLAKDDLWDWREHATIPIIAENRDDILNLLERLPFLKITRHLSPDALADESGVLHAAAEFYKATEFITRL